MATYETNQNYKSSGRQKLRLIIEGREVPVISASTIFKMNMPAMANIELVPLGVIKFIKPRTQVQLFVRDSFTFSDDRFHLCFDGEVMGRGMVKRHDGRAFRITAFDYSSYLDDAKAFFMNPNFLAGKAGEDVLSGDATPSDQAKANAGTVVTTNANPNALMVDYLTKYKDEKDDSGNVGYNIVKGVVEVIKRLALVNEFYRATYERNRILDRIFMFSSGRIGSFLKDLKIEEFFNSYTGAIGGMVSLRQMLMGIMGLIFHEAITVPFPSKRSVTRDTDGKKFDTIANYLFIPDTYLLPPPKCNVIFPSQQIGFEFDEDFRSAPTRYGFRCSFQMAPGEADTGMTYPIQYYPNPFSDYMFKQQGKETRFSSESDLNSGFGPSVLLKGSDGQSYGSLYFGKPAKNSSGKLNSVGPTYNLSLKEADYLSNEESLKGIYYESDVLPPSYSALVRSGSIGSGSDAETRNQFTRAIGAYLFFKKRYGSRQVSANIMFNPFLVQGFNAIFLDNSEAGQSFIAKVQGVSHNFTNQGFTTSVDLAYGRDFDEIDFMSGGAGDPPLPKWFDSSIFGKVDTDKTQYNLESEYLAHTGAISPSNTKKTSEYDFRRDYVKKPTIFPDLSKFYNPLLGCNSVTFVGAVPKKKGDVQPVIVSTRGAVQHLINLYNQKYKEGGQNAVDAFVRSYTQRPVMKMLETMEFLGAEASGGHVPDEFAKFVAIKDSKRTGLPNRFDGIGYSDEKILAIRRQVVDTYVQELRIRRGFRG